MRRRVPTDLLPHIPHLLSDLPPTEWKASLGTKDLEEAKRLLRLRLVEIDRQIATARAKVSNTASAPLSVESAQRIAQNELAVWMGEDAFWRLENGEAAYDTAAEILEKAAPRIRRAYAVGDWRDALVEAEDALERAGQWFPSGDPSTTLLAQELLKARARFVELLEKRQRGEVADVPDPPPVAQSPGQQPATGGKALADLIRDYRAARELEHGEESTRRKYSHIFKALEEVLGANKPIAEITRADCRAVLALLRELPSSAAKKYPGLSLKEAVEAGRRDEAPVLAPNTVASYLQNLSALFNWAVDEDLLSKNPAKGMAGKGRANVKRRGFSSEELRTLFAALAPLRKESPARFWVPALALFSGARLNELCQLAVSDVGEADGISFLDFSEFDAETGERVQDRSLKTEASDRRVPVHEELISAGFLAFVQKARESGGGRLFPELPLARDGRYSHEFSKWFGRFLDRIDLSARALVFHSFRHGFRDACREAGVSGETADALGGWASAGIGSSYGERGRLTVLARASAKVHFPDFRLANFAAPPMT
jgi:integrase